MHQLPVPLGLADDALLAEGFMSTREVADFLRITPRGVRKMIERGRLTAFRRGPNGGLMVPRRSVMLLVEDGTAHRLRRRAEEMA